MASLGLLMAGLGEQIQMMASEAATAVIMADKNRVLDEFRAQLRREAYSTLESVIATSKKELTLQALADLKEMQEAEARGICETVACQDREGYGIRRAKHRRAWHRSEPAGREHGCPYYRTPAGQHE